MNNLFSGIYKNKTVLVTGHTGFKGSWLSLWLYKMGAKVIGYSLAPDTKPSHHELLNSEIISIYGDIRDSDSLDSVFNEYKPDIVFHLAAQALVRKSYSEPIETYESNVMGTLRIYEAARKHNVSSIVNITSDKVYENKEWHWGYRENDRLGGYDPYSSSKACAEILSQSYRNSFFNISNYGETHNTLLASCRAGNVIGGGDWAQDRLVVDVVKAAANSETVHLRSPHSVRPWQHVLDPLSGYLSIGQKLLEKKVYFSDNWNFGPVDCTGATVETVTKKMNTIWNKVQYTKSEVDPELHEAKLLRLDSSKAKNDLKWTSVWSYEESVSRTVNWYMEFYENEKVVTINDLEKYVADASAKGLFWTRS